MKKSNYTIRFENLDLKLYVQMGDQFPDKARTVVHVSICAKRVVMATCCTASLQ